MEAKAKSELTAELNTVISLLEARLPANINSPVNQKLEAAVKRDMAEYFKSLEMALPMNEIEALYYKYAEVE